MVEVNRKDARTLRSSQIILSAGVISSSVFGMGRLSTYHICQHRFLLFMISLLDRSQYSHPLLWPKLDARAWPEAESWC